ncbi:kinase-like domain-containing protein [Mucor lusitanicus]|uniref:Kinase-like domain-containing protein n=2 Tax=Mucor circinelloides f. lusitanicus TaxID=29924 RepID=A0A8H4EWR0_MUCCL|nr:kinase-like domain-containing protein [Mucor lusitanicus]
MVIGQEYEIVQPLGQGGNARVYLAQCIKDNSYAVLKALPKSNNDERTQLKQLEASIHQSLKHPHVVSLDRVIQDNSYIYLIMELCDQGDLFDYLCADHDKSSVSHGDAVKHMFSQILDGVEHIHANNVYHHDLKIENVFLKSQAGEQVAICKVGDFGLSSRERYTLEHLCGSTASYLGPEHWDASKKHRPYDAAAFDVWALGIMLLLMIFGGYYPWEMASDDDPSFSEFKRDSSVLKKRYPEISDSGLRLLQFMLAVDPASRPSVSEVKKQLSSIDCLLVEAECLQQQHQEQ